MIAVGVFFFVTKEREKISIVGDGSASYQEQSDQFEDEPVKIIRYKEEAKALSLKVLRETLLKDGAQIKKDFNTELALKMNAYISVYEETSVYTSDKEIQLLKMELSKLSELHGWCWGIPDGQCRE